LLFSHWSESITYTQADHERLFRRLVTFSYLAYLLVDLIGVAASSALLH